MIIEQKINETLLRHYSDVGMMIRQAETGALYSDAVDVTPCRYTYQETGTPIERPLDSWQQSVEKRLTDLSNNNLFASYEDLSGAVREGVNKTE